MKIEVKNKKGPNIWGRIVSCEIHEAGHYAFVLVAWDNGYLTVEHTDSLEVKIYDED